MPVTDYGSDSVRDTFDRDAAAYDAARRRLVPCFDAFYGTVARCLAGLPASARVLDLGAGTGLLSGLLLERVPVERIDLVDVSEGMLAVARQRFTTDGCARVTFTVAAMEDFFPAADTAYDAVMSALAIHHLADDAKRALFRRVHDGLAPGGVFVNADQVAAPTPFLDAHYRAWWEHDCRRAGATDDDLAGAADRMKHDRCATVEDQLAWIREAGFMDVDAPYQNGMFAVFRAIKRDGG